MASFCVPRENQWNSIFLWEAKLLIELPKINSYNPAQNRRLSECSDSISNCNGGK